MQSEFGHGDGAFGANFNTGLATQTFVGVDRLGLAALHFKNLSGASVYTLFITGTFVFVNNDFPHGTTSKMNELRTLKTMLLQPRLQGKTIRKNRFSLKDSPCFVKLKDISTPGQAAGQQRLTCRNHHPSGRDRHTGLSSAQRFF
jgi:hypothetical protein